MPGYRCINNHSGYCSTTPAGEKVSISDPTDLAIESGYVDYFITGSCTLDPLNCGFFISWQDECQRLKAIKGV